VFVRKNKNRTACKGGNGEKWGRKRSSNTIIKTLAVVVLTASQ